MMRLSHFLPINTDSGIILIPQFVYDEDEDEEDDEDETEDSSDDGVYDGVWPAVIIASVGVIGFAVFLWFVIKITLVA